MLLKQEVKANIEQNSPSYEERLKIFANLLLDRIIEDHKKGVLQSKIRKFKLEE